MSEMIERGAKAIFESQPRMPGDNRDFAKAYHWEQCSCRNAARAMLKAIREPDAAMIEAADEIGIDQPALDYWPAMIDAALKE